MDAQTHHNTIWWNHSDVYKPRKVHCTIPWSVFLTLANAAIFMPFHNIVVKEYFKNSQTIKTLTLTEKKRERTTLQLALQTAVSWDKRHRHQFRSPGNSSICLKKSFVWFLFSFSTPCPLTKDRHIMKKQTTYPTGRLKTACHKGLRFLLWIPSYKIHHSLRFLLQYFFVHFYAQNCLNWRQSFPVAGSTLQPLTNVWISVGFASVKVKLQQYRSKAPATKQQTSNRKAKATSAPTTQQAVTNLFRNKSRIKLLCFIKMWRTGIDQVTNSCLH